MILIGLAMKFIFYIMRLKAYTNGTETVGVPNWQYDRVHLIENVLVDNIQSNFLITTPSLS